MATEVYTVETIKLVDGTEIELKPLPIKRLKEFMALLNEMDSNVSEIDFMDQTLGLAAKCLEKNPAMKDIEDLEEVLDLDSAFKIIEVCSGVKLNDPKMLEAVNQILETNQPVDGKS